MERLFKLEENGTSVKTEVIAGITTFMTMAYILVLNPNLLTGWRAGGDQLWNAVFLATCLASAIAMVCMAFLANKPFCLAPGMGLNSFFAAVVAQIATITGASYVASFQAALVIIFAEGIVFVVLTLCSIREKVVRAIPYGVRMGLAPAIGLLLLDVGLGSNAGVFNDLGDSFYVMRDFFGALTAESAASTMGTAYPVMVLTVVTMFVGFFAIVLLNKRGVRGAVLIGMVIASVVYWAGEALFLGANPFASLASASWLPAFSDFAELTLFKFNLSGFMELGWLTAVTIIVTFCMIDLFDTIGGLIGLATNTQLMDEDGKMPKMKEAMLSDSIGTVAGACMGTSTITTFAESAAGIEAGGRTGLTALTCACLFALCVFMGPVVAVIPAAATSSALIYVGVMMLTGLKNIDFNRIDVAAPVALMLIGMPVSGSIGHSIGIGLIAFSVINIFSGEASRKYAFTYALSLLFLAKFFFIA